MVQPASVFSADVRNGPDSGLSLWGTLRFTVAPRSHQITGVLIPGGGGPRVPLSGRIAGRTVEYVFHLPGGRLMRGVGSAPRDILRYYNGPPTTGTLSGPRPGDTGKWASISQGQLSFQQVVTWPFA